MRIIKTHEMNPEELSPWERDQVYNGLDVCVTRDCLDAMLPQLDEHTEKTYEFSKALQGPTLEMRVRGVLVDQARKAEVIDEYYAIMETLEAQLERIVLDGVGLPSFNWRSHRDLHRLFYDTFGLPTVRKQGRPTTDRGAREKLGIYPIAEQIIKHINTLTELGDKISVLKTDLDADGRIRTSYNIAGTSTGSKIGSASTQKLGFWGATAVVQPTTAGAAATFTANAGTAVNDASTFDGYTLNQVVKALRTIGILA